MKTNVVMHVKMQMMNVWHRVIGHNVVLSKQNMLMQRVCLFIIIKQNFFLYFFIYLVNERQCTTERWARDLLADGCITYMKTYWCMCSSDMCNGGDLESIRGWV
jgi:hypothetical protein